VTTAARPISAPNLVSASFGLADGVALLEREPFFFVLEGSSLSGIVTHSDLQKPVVSMVLFAFIVAAEAGIDRLCEAWVGPEWFQRLTENRRTKVQKVLDDRRRHRTDLTLLECLSLDDRLTLVSKCRTLRKALGHSRATFDAWSKELKRVRNVLAHGGNLLNVSPATGRAVELFGRVRRFAESVWQLPARLPDVAEVSPRRSRGIARAHESVDIARRESEFDHGLAERKNSSRSAPAGQLLCTRYRPLRGTANGWLGYTPDSNTPVLAIVPTGPGGRGKPNPADVYRCDAQGELTRRPVASYANVSEAARAHLRRGTQWADLVGQTPGRFARSRPSKR
jgi:hypothetical protein